MEGLTTAGMDFRSLDAVLIVSFSEPLLLLMKIISREILHGQQNIFIARVRLEMKQNIDISLLIHSNSFDIPLIVLARHITI